MQETAEASHRKPALRRTMALYLRAVLVRQAYKRAITHQLSLTKYPRLTVGPEFFQIFARAVAEFARFLTTVGLEP